MQKKKSNLSSVALAKDEVSNQKILQAIQGLNKRIDGLDQGLNKRIDGLDQGLNKRIDGLDQGLNKRIDGLDKKVTQNSNSIVDILSAINLFAEDTGQKFKKIDQRFDKMNNRMDGMNNRMDGMNSKIITIQSTMVTKNYLDDKLSDFKVNIMGTVHKNVENLEQSRKNNKVNTLVNILGDKKVLTKKESKLIMTT